MCLDPALGQRYIEITVADLAAWHTRLKTDLRKRAREAKRANGDGSGEASHVYKFVSGVFKGAVTRGLIDSSPARITGAGRYRRHRAPQVLTPGEVRALASALPERLHALADLLAWSGLRIGEVRALRRRDLNLDDVDEASVTVARNVSQGGKGVGAVIGRVKTDAGLRTVAIPRELALALVGHLTCTGLVPWSGDSG